MITGLDITLGLDLLQVLTPEQAWHYHIIPKAAGDEQISFYIDEKAYDPLIAEELEVLLGKPVTLEKAPTDIIRKALGRYYQRQQGQKQPMTTGLNGRTEDFLLKLIREARGLRSSDIHVEIYEEVCRVRIRIDGLLVERYSIGKADYPALINKIKIMANLDISEKRLPQDGRIFFSAGGGASQEEKLDIRVSVLPTLHGEKIVLRLLGTDASNIDIHTLGFSELDLQNYLQAVKKPHGIILISGPTGSGKTTTLYATLRILNQSTRNILTIEDPIEYTLEGVNQVQLKEDIGLTFAKALRTFLRQDPDIIMVGEIRDQETATMAIRAALTGHLVLSTIHTNSAWGTVSRLADMGVPPYLIAGTLNLSVAQRLVRLLCPDCKAKEPFKAEYYPKGFKPYRDISEHYTARGCERCHYTGFRGRNAIFEVIPLDSELAENIKRGELEVARQLRERGIRTLAENAFELFAKGHTSIEEIYPVLLNM